MSNHWMLAALLLIPAVAGADTITFKNGSKMQGITTVRGDSLEVRVPEGSLFFARSLVAEIASGATPLTEYEARLKVLPAKDVKATFELGQYCEAHGMRAQAEALFKKTLALEPGHERARQQLGFKKVGDRWVNASELMTELGLVQYKGEWMSARAARDMQELDERSKRLESRLASLEKESGDTKRSLDEERLAHDRSERYTDERLRQLEAEKRQLASQPAIYYTSGWPYGYVTNRGTNRSHGTTYPGRTAFGIPPVNKRIVIP